MGRRTGRAGVVRVHSESYAPSHDSAIEHGCLTLIDCLGSVHLQLQHALMLRCPIARSCHTPQPVSSQNRSPSMSTLVPLLPFPFPLHVFTPKCKLKFILHTVGSVPTMAFACQCPSQDYYHMSCRNWVKTDQASPRTQPDQDCERTSSQSDTIHS